MFVKKMSNNWPPNYKLTDYETWMNTYPKEQIEKCRMQLIKSFFIPRSQLMQTIMPKIGIDSPGTRANHNRPLIVPPGCILHNTLNQHLYSGSAHGHIHINDNHIGNLYPMDIWHCRLEQMNPEMEADRIIEKCKKYTDMYVDDDGDLSSSSSESTSSADLAPSAPNSCLQSSSEASCSSASQSGLSTASSSSESDLRNKLIKNLPSKTVDDGPLLLQGPAAETFRKSHSLGDMVIQEKDNALKKSNSTVQVKHRPDFIGNMTSDEPPAKQLKKTPSFIAPIKFEEPVARPGLAMCSPPARIQVQGHIPIASPSYRGRFVVGPQPIATFGSAERISVHQRIGTPGQQQPNWNNQANGGYVNGYGQQVNWNNPAIGGYANGYGQQVNWNNKANGGYVNNYGQGNKRVLEEEEEEEEPSGSYKRFRYSDPTTRYNRQW